MFHFLYGGVYSIIFGEMEIEISVKLQNRTFYN